METNQVTGKLATKLVAIMAAVDHVEKRGRNQKQGYDFVRAADLYHTVRKAFIEQQVFMSADVVSEERWTQPTQSGGTMNYCSLRVGFTFYDGETGACIGPVHGYGWGSDVGDKAIYKAMTGALKYAARTNFLVPDDSDPEEDAAPAPRNNRRAPTTTPEPTPASAPSQSSEVISTPQAKRLFAMAREHGVDADKLKDFIFQRFNYVSSKDVLRKDYEEICNWVCGGGRMQ